MSQVPVVIAGGGPVGMMLAKELASRGISCLLAERNPTTTRHPKMDITNGRTMEHFRRLGMIDRIRGAAVAEDHPFDVSWITDLSSYELARFSYPNVDEARKIIRYVNDGSQPLEPDMRVSQVDLEPVLKSFLDEEPLVDVRFGWAFERFVEEDDRVVVTLKETATGAEEEVECAYLAGCDGGNSRVREQLGIALEGTPNVAQMYMVHFRSEARDVLQRWGVAWHYQSAKGTMIAQNDRDIWTIHAPVPPGIDPESIDPRQIVTDFAGCEFDFDVLVANAWTPHLVLAESYGKGRIYLAGDASHQYVPTGGYGMNTGMGDAVDLGWKLAAMVQGWGGPELLPSYDVERRAVGARSRQGSERHVGVRFEIAMCYTPDLDDPSADTARKEAGDKILALGNAENEALGVEIGYRYDPSPIVWGEQGEAPENDLITYQPTTWPGSRLPSVYLADGQAVFDLLGQGFTLITFGNSDTSKWEAAAQSAGIPLAVLKLSEPAVREIYECDHLLIRPDQHVAWRGDSLDLDARKVFARVSGNTP